MFALIYDTHDLKKPFKQVLSVHETRETAQRALEKRLASLGKQMWACDARIVWLTEDAKPGYGVTEQAFSDWQPGEGPP
jgi:hypothetical protein